MVKHKKHIDGEVIPSGQRICNVCICLKCNKEFLLGLRCECGNIGHHKLRRNPTLIPVGKYNGLLV